MMEKLNGYKIFCTSCDDFSFSVINVDMLLDTHVAIWCFFLFLFLFIYLISHFSLGNENRRTAESIGLKIAPEVNLDEFYVW